MKPGFIGIVIIWVVVIFNFFTPLVLATEYTSPSFKILDPVLDTGGTQNSTSSSGILQLGSVGEVSIGRSNSSNFELRAGFLFFPSLVVATPSATTTIVVGPGSGGRVPPGILKKQLRRPSCVDLNDDGDVGLADASIQFFNWLPSEKARAGFKLKDKRPDCNNDNLVNIIDLSIMLFWWDER
ncbi:hypothetical protein C4553_00020 [Candidatus Parcubacteria bacterium]|nr:MAG: hypothetical protein C4553_00020 [Candidatus Parcubacteria bacterium]